MFTDIVGYTALMGEDEQKALSLLKTNRKVHKKWIHYFNGKWLKEMGDGVLASFTTVSDAIFCAGAIQKESKNIENLNLSIGIHMGEVIVEVGDVFGDGVNIASRIESQASAGDIYVSDSVYRNLINKQGVEADFVKEEYLKNVKHPVKIYNVTVEMPAETMEFEQPIQHDETEMDLTKQDVRRITKFVIGIVAVILLIIAGFFVYNVFLKGEPSSESKIKSILVLPFENLGNVEDDYFSNGITEEITSRLGLIKELIIISPLSVSDYKNRDKSITEIARELDIEYILDGSVRWDKIGESQLVRITPRLTEISSSVQVWTNNYERDLDQIFEVQSEIAERIAEALDVKLLLTEKESIQNKPTENIEAYDLYLRGMDYYNNRISGANLKIAEQLLMSSIQLDHNFAAAYARLGIINLDFWWFYFDRDSIRLEQSKYFIDKALEIDPDLPEGFYAKGHYFYHGFREYDKALTEFFKLLKILPNNSEATEYIGYVKRRQGHYREAIEWLNKAHKINPLSTRILYALGETYTSIREYELAIQSLDQALTLSPDWPQAYYMKSTAMILSSGNTKGAIHTMQAGLEVVNLEVKGAMYYSLAAYYIYERNYGQAIKILNSLVPAELDFQFIYTTKYSFLAEIYSLLGQNDKKLVNLDSALQITTKRLENSFSDSRIHSALGFIYAGLGKKDKAIEEGKMAIDLMPMSIDRSFGYYREIDMARIYTIVGEYELALEKIDQLLSQPGFFSVAQLEIDPLYDPLREHPQYQAIINKYNE